MVKKFWETIAPKQWKVGYQESKSKSKRKLRQNCRNPFHFCEKISDLSHQRRTLCACSDMVQKHDVKILPDIRYFLTKCPKQTFPNLIYPRRYDMVGSNVPPKHLNVLVQDDLVREAHDRGKRKKKKKKFL